MQDYITFTDEELVQLFKEGNEFAFSELYSRYEQKLKRLIYYYVPNVDDASDVFHETVIRVFRHINTYNTRKPFSSWIYQIAINCSKNYIKRYKRDNRLVEKEKFRMNKGVLHADSAEDVFISNYDLDEFNKSIDNLKEKFKAVFVLRHDHKMKYSDIARILKCSERTAKWRMEKAVEKIAQYLSDKGII